jgi:nicotinate-nucleotide pyrophosphorylase (carboxylating)
VASIEIADEAEGIIRLALAEDLGVEGDVTTTALLEPETTGSALIIARTVCVISGQPVAARVFERVEPSVTYRADVPDGGKATPGQTISTVQGPTAGILTGERTALNFLCHMSGISTVTSRMVDIAAPHGVRVMDTRKTSPGLRVLEKYAVRMGGGANHRGGLFDGVLIKDNHIAGAGGIEVAVRKVRNSLGDRFPVEVEAADLAQVREALSASADIIMLDNMSPDKIRDAVAMIDGRATVEISGGVNPDNFASLVKLGADRISLGFITHSAPSADLSLELE